MNRETVEALVSADHIAGANVLAAMLGETKWFELNTFAARYERDGQQFAWVGVQVMPYWWSNPDWENPPEHATEAQKRPGALELIAQRDLGVPIEFLCVRPAWDEEEVLDMDAARATFATLQAVENLPESVEELPSGLIIFKGTGLIGAYGLTRIDDETDS